MTGTDLRFDLPQPQVAVAQLGARRQYAIPSILHQAGLLDRLYTDACANVGVLRFLDAAVPNWLRPSGLDRLLNRRVCGVPARKIRCFPRFALSRELRKKRVNTPGQLIKFYQAANEAFGRIVAMNGFGVADTFYGFNCAALEMMKQAKQMGMRTILDQTEAPIALQQSILRDERETWPHWEGDDVEPNDWQPMAEREAMEWELADAVLCGSDYVRKGLDQQAGPSGRCVVVPYAAGPSFFRSKPRRRINGEFRVLFVGTVCLRKGIPYLLQTARLTGPVGYTFRVVGPNRLSETALREIGGTLELRGRVPRTSIREQYEWADVVVMPSLSEGSANVCYEALAAGLPIITTDNAGSVVRNGIDGYITPIRDAEAMADRLTTLAANPELYEYFSKNALLRSKEFTWDQYAQHLVRAVRQLSEGDSRSDCKT